MPTYGGTLDQPTFATIRRYFYNQPKNVAFLVHSLDFRKELGLIEQQSDSARRRLEKTCPLFEAEVKDENGNSSKVSKQNFIIRGAFAKYALKPIGQFEVKFRGRSCYGLFLFVPYLPEEFQDPRKKREILGTLKQALMVAKEHGAEYVGLGAFTSIISANGLLLQNDSPVPLTSGSSGTAVWNERGVMHGCQQLGIKPRRSTLVILGTGSVGTPTALLLAHRFQRTILCARGRADLESLRANLIQLGCKPNRIEINNSDFNAAARDADVLVLATSVASSAQLALDPRMIRPGSLVLDVGRPRNFPPEAVATAPYLVIDGSICRFPGKITDDSYKLVGMGQPNEAWGCLAETIFRGLDGELASTSIGNFIRRGELKEAQRMLRVLNAKMSRCGFELASLRSNDVALSPERIQEVRVIRRRALKLQRMQHVQHIKHNLNANWERFAGRPSEQPGTP